MGRRTLTLLTWLTLAAAVASALWLAWRGAPAMRFGFAPLVLGRPAPPADVGEPGHPRGKAPAGALQRSAPRSRD